MEPAMLTTKTANVSRVNKSYARPTKKVTARWAFANAKTGNGGAANNDSRDRTAKAVPLLAWMPLEAPPETKIAMARLTTTPPTAWTRSTARSS